jgi:hypothetical protein
MDVPMLDQMGDKRVKELNPELEQKLKKLSVNSDEDEAI